MSGPAAIRPGRPGWGLLVAALLLAAAGCTGPRRAALEQGRAAYERGEYRTAWRLLEPFARAGEQEADYLAAAGHAALALNRFDRAIPLLRRAVDLEPGQALYWEWYLSALSWAGILSDQHPLLDEALERGGEGLIVAHDRPVAYDGLLSAADALHGLDRYRRCLNQVLARHPDSPVAEVKYYEFLMQAALVAADTLRFDRIRQDLSARVAAWGTNAGDPGRLDDAALYRLALGSFLVGQQDRATDLAERLAGRAGSGRLSRPLIFNYLVVPYYREAFGSGDPDRVLELVATWLPRLAPDWESDLDYRRILLDWQVDALIRRIRVRGAAPGTLDSLLSVATELFRRDPAGAVDPYEQLAAFLAEQGETEESARVGRWIEEEGRAAEAPGEEPIAEPEVSGIVLRDGEGHPVPLSGFSGRVVVLQFWADWSAVSEEMLRQLDGIARRYRNAGSPVTVLAVAIALPSDELAGPEWWRDLSLEQVVDGGASIELGVAAVPSTLVIDPSGRVRWRLPGYPGATPYIERLTGLLGGLLP